MNDTGPHHLNDVDPPHLYHFLPVKEERRVGQVKQRRLDRPRSHLGDCKQVLLLFSVSVC